MTPAELMNGAMSVEQQGIPVDWKGLAVKVFESANARIVELEKALEVHLPDEEADDGESE